jgi:hypothetical protein
VRDGSENPFSQFEFPLLAEISRRKERIARPCGHAQINKTVCKKEFQVKLRTFHQLKTNDFDDGGLMIIGVYSSFLIPREEEPQIMSRWLTSW